MLRRIAVALFVAAVPLFLITTNVRWVIDTPLLYSYGFDKYDIEARTGIEGSELRSAGRQIRDYFNNSDEFLIVSVVRNGERLRNLYNSREVLHMKDVKGLVQGVYRVQEASGAYLAAFALIGLAVWRRGFVSSLARYAGLGGAVTVGLIVVTGLVSLVGFDRLFTAFHLVSFSNDLWRLDPRTDYLIIMFPEGFFLDATLWIAGSTVLEAVILTAAAMAVTGWRPRWVRGVYGEARPDAA